MEECVRAGNMLRIPVSAVAYRIFDKGPSYIPLFHVEVYSLLFLDRL